MVKKLLPYVPEHKVYVEVFGGGMKLLLAKEPSVTEVYNDIDSNLVNFFRVLRDDQLHQQLIRMCKLTPYSREEFNQMRSDLDQTEDKVERAWKFFTICRMAFAGRHKSPSWAKCITRPSREMALHVSSYISAIEMLEPLHARLFRVLIEHQDFRKTILDYDSADTFFYLDPTYVRSTRQGNDRFKHEMTDEDHVDLVKMLLSIRGKCMLSGYDNNIYNPLEQSGWKKIKFDASCFAAARTDETGLNTEGEITRTQKRTECIWMSYRITRKQIPLFA
jgi:DNA adenine methylase